MSTVIISLFCFGAVVMVIATMIMIAVARFILKGFRNDD
jgi:hypothetical protein